jgi:hypothetical protein
MDPWKRKHSVVSKDELHQRSGNDLFLIFNFVTLSVKFTSRSSKTVAVLETLF